MTIFDRTGQGPTVTEGQRAFELFVDRYELSRSFVSYLNDDPAPGRLLFFHGEAGCGKSLLLRLLSERCCKRFERDNWEWLKELPDEQWLAHVADAQGTEVVPQARINFATPPHGEDRPREAFSALLILRRALSTSNLRFPLFDFACLWYLHATGRLTEDRVRLLFPAEASGLIKDLVGVVSKSFLVTKAASEVLRLLQKHLGKPYMLYRAKRGLTESEVEDIARRDPDNDLIYRLPGLLAADLNTSMEMKGAPSRVVLFIDTHEALWGTLGAMSDALYFERDEWLRSLIASLEIESGIVVVVTGESPPRWSAAQRAAIPNEFIDLQRVTPLSRKDAIDYLDAAGVRDSSAQESAIADASIKPGEVHALLLGMCADVWLMAPSSRGHLANPTSSDVEQGTERKGRELVSRLFKHADPETEAGARALCACRAFDESLYLWLGDELHFHATKSAFRVLIQFSFVSSSEGRADGWYRMHDLLRRLEHAQQNDLLIKAHQCLANLYCKRYEEGDIAALGEAIYHRSQFEWEAAINEWLVVFAASLNASRYDYCRTLLDARTELRIESATWMARVSEAVGQYFASLERHQEARDEYLDAARLSERALELVPDDPLAHHCRALAIQGLGELAAEQAQTEKARSAYESAIGSYDQALELDPTFLMAHSNRALTMQRLGELEVKLARIDEARSAFGKATTGFDRALKIDPVESNLHNNRALALQRLGDLEDDKQALSTYTEAIAGFDLALELAPDNAAAHSNRGIVLQGLGEIAARLGRSDEARSAYEEAIAAHGRAIEIAPDFVMAYQNIALTLQTFGDLEAQLGHTEEARSVCMLALEAYETALELAPNFLLAHSNRAGTLERLATLEFELGHSEEARSVYTRAIAGYERILEIAPEDLGKHHGRAIALAQLAQLEVVLEHGEEARVAYSQAFEAFDRALAFDPEDIATHSNRAIALQRQASFEAELGLADRARQIYVEAARGYDRILELSPEDADAHINRAEVSSRLGEMEAGLGLIEEARSAYTQAVEGYDWVLKATPGKAAVHTRRAFTLGIIGDLEVDLERIGEGLSAYWQAIAGFDQTLNLAPNDEDAHVYRAGVFHRLALLEKMLGRMDQAKSAYLEAIAGYDRVQEIAPDNVEAREVRAMAIQRLEDL